MTTKELHEAVRRGLPVYVTTMERFEWQQNSGNGGICDRADHIVKVGSVVYPYFVEDGLNKYFHATTAPVSHDTNAYDLGDFEYVGLINDIYPGVYGVALHPKQVEIFDPTQYEMTDISQFRKTIMEIDNEGK